MMMIGDRRCFQGGNRVSNATYVYLNTKNTDTYTELNVFDLKHVYTSFQ